MRWYTCFFGGKDNSRLTKFKSKSQKRFFQRKCGFPAIHEPRINNSTTSNFARPPFGTSDREIRHCDPRDQTLDLQGGEGTSASICSQRGGLVWRVQTTEFFTTVTTPRFRPTSPLAKPSYYQAPQSSKEPRVHIILHPLQFALMSRPFILLTMINVPGNYE
jgi:hypothetical protein